MAWQRCCCHRGVVILRRGKQWAAGGGRQKTVDQEEGRERGRQRRHVTACLLGWRVSVDGGWERGGGEGGGTRRAFHGGFSVDHSIWLQSNFYLARDFTVMPLQLALKNGIIGKILTRRFAWAG